MKRSVFHWQRVDMPGLERLVLERTDTGIVATSTVLCLEAGGYRLDYVWDFDPSWQTRSVSIRRRGENGETSRLLERKDGNWYVDGSLREDLACVDHPDLSVTPFCNTPPILDLSSHAGDELTIATAFIDGNDLSVGKSSQKYVRRGPLLVRYVDLGLSKGFEADLAIDEAGFVLDYEGLFKRVTPAA